MPRKRKYSTRYRRYRRPWWVRAIIANSRAIGRMANVETKYIDANNDGTIDSSGTINGLNLIAQGDGNTQRDGNQVRMLDLFVRLNAVQHSSATNTLVRYIAFVDTQSAGATPAVTDVLQASNIASPLNKENAYRFKILIDKTITLSTGGNTYKAMKIYRKLPKYWQKARYIGTTAAVGSQGTNAMWSLTISDEATNTPQVQRYSRVKFLDN